MKQFKVLVALVLAMTLVLSLSASALAGTITVDKVKKGETYDAYKLLNYTKNGNAYSYYLTAAQYNSFGSVLTGIGFEFVASADGSTYTLKETSMTAAQITAALKNADLTNALQHESKTASADGALTFDNDLEVGYWYVTSSLGALTTLESYDAQALVVEKNTIPTVDKTESTTESNYTNGPIDEHIGDTVYYQIVVTDGVGTDAELTLTDTMTAGLDYKTGSLKINGTAVADNADTTNWKVTVNGRVITIVFTSDYVASVGTGETITVTYQATINANAVVNSADGNENKVVLDYSAQHSEDKVYVRTYDLIVKKVITGTSTFLPGAKFKLYDAETGGNQVRVTPPAQGTTVYRYDSNADPNIQIEVFVNGTTVTGLVPGDYWLEETTTPSGYNPLSSRQKVTVTAGQTATAEITIENSSGTELPSTGGIGTTIFYIAGAVLVLGAAAVILARRKAEQE